MGCSIASGVGQFIAGAALPTMMGFITGKFISNYDRSTESSLNQKTLLNGLRSVIILSSAFYIFGEADSLSPMKLGAAATALVFSSILAVIPSKNSLTMHGNSISIGTAIGTLATLLGIAQATPTMGFLGGIFGAYSLSSIQSAYD